MRPDQAIIKYVRRHQPVKLTELKNTPLASYKKIIVKLLISGRLDLTENRELIFPR